MALQKVSLKYKSPSDKNLIVTLEDYRRVINSLVDEVSSYTTASSKGYLTIVGSSGTPDYLNEEYFSRSVNNHIIIKNSYTAGAGLSGGGSLNASRTFSLSHLGIESLTDPGADRIFFWDESEDASKWLTVSTGLQISTTNLTTKDSEIDHDQLLNFAAGEHFLQTDIAYISTALSTGLLKVTTGTGALSIITDASANWNTAYGWGNHASGGYLKADGTVYLAGNWMQNIGDIGLWGDGTGCSLWATSTGDSNVYGAFFRGRHCRGSKASPTACVSGDRIGGFLGQGYDYDSWVTAASIEFFVTGTIADTRLPGEMRVYLNTDATPSVKTEYMRLTNEGYLCIKDGVTAPSGNIAGMAQIFIDTSDGDLKIRFSDGTIKTIVVDT